MLNRRNEEKISGRGQSFHYQVAAQYSSHVAEGSLLNAKRFLIRAIGRKRVWIEERERIVSLECISEMGFDLGGGVSVTTRFSFGYSPLRLVLNINEEEQQHRKSSC